MDLTQGTTQEKNTRAKKMMLWFAMASMFMSFAGLISAYIVSKSRPDWILGFELPSAFYINLGVIAASSLCLFMARTAVESNMRAQANVYLGLSLILGVTFVFLQFKGFSQIIADGYYFTGAQSTVTTSFLYIITVYHMLHVFAGLIVLLVVIYNQFKQKYTAQDSLGLELGEQFWHFLGFLWICLFLFFYFLK